MNITSHYSTTIKKLSHYSKTEQIQTATIDTLLLYYQAIILLWKKAYRSLCYYTSTVVFMYTKEAHRSSSLTSHYFISQSILKCVVPLSFHTQGFEERSLSPRLGLEKSSTFTLPAKPASLRHLSPHSLLPASLYFSLTFSLSSTYIVLY